MPWQYYSIGIDATVALHGIQFFLRYSPTNSADWFSFNMLDMKRLNPGNVCKAYQAIISKQGNIHDMQFCIEHAVQGTAANEMLILHRIMMEWWIEVHFHLQPICIAGAEQHSNFPTFSRIKFTEKWPIACKNMEFSLKYHDIHIERGCGSCTNAHLISLVTQIRHDLAIKAMKIYWYCSPLISTNLPYNDRVLAQWNHIFFVIHVFTVM